MSACDGTPILAATSAIGLVLASRAISMSDLTDTGTSSEEFFFRSARYLAGIGFWFLAKVGGQDIGLSRAARQASAAKIVAAPTISPILYVSVQSRRACLLRLTVQEDGRVSRHYNAKEWDAGTGQSAMGIEYRAAQLSALARQKTLRRRVYEVIETGQ